MEQLSLQLKRACVAGDPDEVRRLLALGAGANSTDQHRSGTLISFHPPVVEDLLAHGADPNTQTDENGVPVLAGLAYQVHRDGKLPE